ncbi:MAG: WG repeat-containing protein [Dysgonamonadaceae bacterium]|jgi:hypothetical protein|nr:WG repeat-containing protein [Dysgonamonadaceae bacterium]
MKKVNLFSLSLLLTAAAMLTGCGGGGSSAPGIELFPVQSGSNYGYIDQKGVIVINPQFDKATVFRDGVALVRTDGSDRWAYINRKGEFVNEKRYKDASSFSEGLAWTVEDDQAPTAINAKGDVKFTLKEAMNVRIFHDGLAAFSNSQSLWGFADKSGKVKIEPKYKRVGDFDEGLCPALDGETYKWGYINTKGEFAVNPQFDEAGKFVNGLAVVELDDKYGAVDKNGKYVINPQFDRMESDGDLFLVRQDGKHGWCNKKGQFVINPQFKYVIGFCGSNIAVVSNGNTWGYVDREGKYVINPQFEMALPFSGKLALVYNGKQIGLIDKKGSYVVNPQFKDVADDVFSYIKGEAKYNTVKSDYFNAEDVVAAFDFNSPEGLTAASTYQDIVNKLGIKQSAFSKYSDSHVAVKDRLLGTKVTCSLTINGTPYDKKVSPGWWSFTDYVYNGNRKPQSYTYTIRSGSHTDEVLGMIDAKIAENHTVEYRDNRTEYSNDAQEIHVSRNNSTIIITIKFKQS